MEDPISKVLEGMRSFPNTPQNLDYTMELRILSITTSYLDIS